MSPTERDLLDLLGARYDFDAGNGQRWVRAEHIRNAAGFSANRTCDFMAQDCWGGGNYAKQTFELHGCEVKTSRSDWLRELRDPTKADAFRPYCHRWWLVVSGPEVAKRDELPRGWGMLTATLRRDKLRCLVSAPCIDAAPMPPAMRVALLRAVQKTAQRQVRVRAAS